MTRCWKSRFVGCCQIRERPALGTRFAAQWLRLQDLDKVHPDALMFPDFHEELAAAMRRETELFFNSLVEDDRSVLDLLRRRLHLRQRPPGPPLRDSRRERRTLPPRRRGESGAPRPAGT